jgi:hypothetical protein
MATHSLSPDQFSEFVKLLTVIKGAIDVDEIKKREGGK